MSDAKYVDALLANGRLREERDSLREQLVHFGELHGAEHRAISTENDQLRAELKGLQRAHDQLADQFAGVSAENDRLREELKHLRKQFLDAEDVEAERDRLREALEKITERVISGEEANRIALAALKEEQR